MVSNENKDGHFCDICGAPHALLRTISNQDYGIIDALSGYTCQKCLDEDKEYEYIEQLVSDLKEDDERRFELTERFEAIRLDQRGWFISEYGVGVKHKTCEICGQNNSYLCIVEDHFDDGHIEMLDEISMWCCASCISTGRQKTRMEHAFVELMSFRIDYSATVAELAEFTNTTQHTRKETKHFASTVSHSAELVAHEKKYDKKAEKMKKDRLAYDGVPVKTIIKTAQEGERCFCCGESCEKDHVFSD